MDDKMTSGEIAKDGEIIITTDFHFQHCYI